jgi:hypothetical protein
MSSISGAAAVVANHDLANDEIISARGFGSDSVRGFIE